MDYKILIKGRDQNREILASPGDNLLEAINRQGTYFSAVCGGKGSCGKCKIRLLDGELGITAADRKHFSEEDLAAGYRLACRAKVEGNLLIEMAAQDEEDFSIQVGHGQEKERGSAVEEREFFIGLDIGTTTLAFQLLGKKNKKIITSFATINRQRAYGADVISRIQASNEGKKDLLQKSIQEDLLTGFRELIKQAGIRQDQVKKIAIACNTTMGHLLMGFSCQGLGGYPFQPVDIGLLKRPFKEVLGSDEMKAEVILLPGISTYVGGDITAGMYAWDMGCKEEVSLLVDLGTNGEMAIGNRKRILTTSTAAGPAFEGGNISWGMGSVTGAICKVEIQDGKPLVQTIGGGKPVGLCGTGVIDTIAELVEAELVDETGRLEDNYFEEGFPLAATENGKMITFTQRDVREIQLAKSAVRAGIEVLLRRFGTSYNDIDKVYLAGGFGYHMDQEKAMAMGLLPEEFAGKVEAVGNSSLAGAVRYLTADDGDRQLTALVELADEIDLSTDPDFNDLYMEHMFFE